MLEITYDKRLASLLGTSRDKLQGVLENADEYYQLLTLHDPAKTHKPRDVVKVVGTLRRFQERFYRKVLLPRLPHSPHSYGGVRGRHPKANAEAHSQSTFILKADISNFYLSIRQPRVYRLFRDQFRCTPPVAKLCTRLCTFDHRLALGLVTSPILADQVLHDVDVQIGRLCEKLGLTYTRYVDDLTISGRFDLSTGSVRDILVKIVARHGFDTNAEKFEFGRLAEGITITGIRKNRRGKLDVATEYAAEVEQQLEDMKRLQEGQRWNRNRLYYTRTQLLGRIEYIRWVNRGRGAKLRRLFHKVDWKAAENMAESQGLIVARKQLKKKPVAPAASTGRLGGTGNKRG